MEARIKGSQQEATSKANSKKSLLERMKKQKTLLLMAAPFVVYVIIFCYTPLIGWLMAFQNFKPAKGLFDQVWCGLDQFKFLFSDKTFLGVLRNTLCMSLINLTLGFVTSIGFALLLNEVKNVMAKKFVQTVSYLPHFLSWIIVTGIVAEVLSPSTGILNEILMKLHIISQTKNFLADPKWFWAIVGFANVWKEMGWGSIIYLSAITAISPDLYEAAKIDGASRFQRMLHVTLPGIKPTIFILLIMNIGNVLNAGFDQIYNLYSPIVYSTGDIIDTYVYRMSFENAQYSLATAIGLLKSLVSFILIVVSNFCAGKFANYRIF